MAKKEGIKITHNKNLLIIIVLLIAVLIGIIYFPADNRGGEAEEGICKVNNDCIKQQVSCCSCSMGGEERCMTRKQAGEKQKELIESCPEDLICPAVYLCEDTSCECEEGECVEVEE